MRLDSATTSLREGDVLAGKYVVERVLGAGGMGVVLAARHNLLGSSVAIKVLLPAAAGIPGARERFVREARAAAALRSEHVARVMDVGLHEDGTPYLVMEYLTGTDLRRTLRALGPLRVADVAEYVVQVCEAMGEAHGLGIVHRDLKPANIFLTRRPNGTPLVKVLDFGLAKVLENAPKAAGDASLTATGLVVGSPPYMPPEQLRSLKLADARSDIWSLGVVLFELLTGRQPFQADRPEGLIVAIATDHPPPPRSLRPDIPEAMDALILHCLQKDPRNRPQSVRELAAVLEPFVAPRSAPAAVVAANPDGTPPPATAIGPVGVPGHRPPVTSVSDATLPMTRVHSSPDAFSAATPLSDQGGGTTTMTRGSAELPTLPATPHRPRAVLWIAAAAITTILVVSAGLANGLGGGVSVTATAGTTATSVPPEPSIAPVVSASPAAIIVPVASSSADPAAPGGVLPGQVTSSAPSGQATSPSKQATSSPRSAPAGGAGSVPQI